MLMKFKNFSEIMEYLMYEEKKSSKLASGKISRNNMDSFQKEKVYKNSLEAQSFDQELRTSMYMSF